MEYAVTKWLHVLSSTLLFGTGIGSAFYLFFTSLSRDVRAIAIVSRHVVIADWLFTATTMVFQPASGFYMMYLSAIPLSSAWIAWSVALYVLAAACWLPVVWIQMRMRDLAAAAAHDASELPPAYWRLLRRWTALGVPALISFLIVFYLMVAKPV